MNKKPKKRAATRLPSVVLRSHREDTTVAQIVGSRNKDIEIYKMFRRPTDAQMEKTTVICLSQDEVDKLVRLLGRAREN